jgi:hypothetical protein
VLKTAAPDLIWKLLVCGLLHPHTPRGETPRSLRVNVNDLYKILLVKNQPR